MKMNREVKQVHRVERSKMEVLHTVKIGKGQFGHEMLSLLMVADQLVWVQHKQGQYPPSSAFSGKTSGLHENWLWSVIGDEEGGALTKAFESWDKNKNNSMMSYTYLFAFLQALGYDMHRDYGIM